MDASADGMIAGNLSINRVSEGMTAEELLSQSGWFYLKDIFLILDPEKTGKYKLAFKEIQKLIEGDQDPFEIMGRKKFGGRVGILMERFAPWYRQNLIFQTQKVDESMSFQQFIKQKEGYFRLSEVCKAYEDFLPYSYSVLKRTANRADDPLEEMGVCKHETTYLVALPKFEQWLHKEIFE